MEGVQYPETPISLSTGWLYSLSFRRLENLSHYTNRPTNYIFVFGILSIKITIIIVVVVI